MTIVTYCPQAPCEAGPANHKQSAAQRPKGRARKIPPRDPEAEARAAAFFERMHTKRREHYQYIPLEIPTRFGRSHH